MTKLRSLFKTTLLVLSLLESQLRFALLSMNAKLRGRTLSPAERAAWLHGCCRRILGRLGLLLTSSGQLPARGLIVSNHLSHLDILLYGSLGPVIFVAKEEVLRWPLLGLLAASGGTVFVDRTSPTQAAEAAIQIEDHLRGNLPVLLFPEGTSSDGAAVLPFRSPFFEPAIRTATPVTAAAIAYSAEGVDESTLTYWGDKVFFPHLSATLGCRNLGGSISFAASRIFANRKDAAKVTHASVCSLRTDQARLAAVCERPLADSLQLDPTTACR